MQAEDEKRNVWGPRAVGSVLPALLRPAFRRRSPASAQLLTDWSAIVGPALAAVTEPRRLSATTLTVACAGPVAMELQHMTGELLSRINGHLGRIVVERLRFTQDTAAPALASPLAAAIPGPVPVLGLAPGPLHDALARLAAAITTKPRRFTER